MPTRLLKSVYRFQTESVLENCATLGASFKVIRILKEGYTLSFGNRQTLTRSPLTISGYVHPLKNRYLMEALHALIQKNTVEKVLKNQTSLAFFNRLFLVLKPNKKWRPILDLSSLNKYVKLEKFKMETSKSIRTSLQTSERVTSIYFKDAYFHISINPHSRKNLRFHIQGQSYKLKALPFGLSTAATVVQEVKLMAQNKGVRIHQYLDDWLVRATSHQTCLQHTQTLVAICEELGWIVNIEKSELVLK